MKIISHSEPRNSILPYRFQLGPTWALLVAFRLPIYLYRLNLGWMLGHRFLCLVHEGRKSGRPRETCLEVIPHNPAKKESVALSSRGRESAGTATQRKVRRWRVRHWRRTLRAGTRNRCTGGGSCRHH